MAVAVTTVEVEGATSEVQATFPHGLPRGLTASVTSQQQSTIAESEPTSTAVVNPAGIGGTHTVAAPPQASPRVVSEENEATRPPAVAVSASLMPRPVPASSAVDCQLH
eukprot:4907444-Amphidinium_carterae.1